MSEDEKIHEELWDRWQLESLQFYGVNFTLELNESQVDVTIIKEAA